MDNSVGLQGRRVLFALCGFELGGAERQALHLARYLKGLGCDVRVWGHHHHNVGPERVIAECEAAGIPWAEHKFRWPCGKWALLRDGWGMLRALRRFQPDVILPYTTWPNVGCNLFSVAARRAVCIWGQRDLAPLRGNGIERLAYRRASAVVCNAEHEVAHLQRAFGETRAPVFVVHNGVEMAPCLRTRCEWRAALGVSEKTVVVTMLANFRCDKDHAILLQAWRRLLDRGALSRANVRLVMAGADQEAHARIQSLTSDLGLLDMVHFPGHVEDVAGLLAASDVGVLITAAEGLPNAVLEYMASGLPVVATDVPGNREALGGAATDHLLSRVGDVDGLVQQLERVMGQPELREHLGRCNQQRACSEYAVETMCRASEDIIVGLLASRRMQKI